MSSWLSAFEAALVAGDVDRAAAMFAEESYWRDLVSFTWNIKTIEGQHGIADMLRCQVEDLRPSGLAPTATSSYAAA
jgi:putative flavoprotein involved in K+ transport